MLKKLGAALAALTLAGCAATYVTPAAGVRAEALQKADDDIAEVLRREPTASFPARIAIARVETSRYSTPGAECFGRGRMCVVIGHDVETDQDFERIADLPGVAGAVPIGRMLLPEQIDSIKDLRLGAASLKADLLLAYSFDTRFHVEGTEIGPLELVSLGLLPHKKAHVTVTASAALFDVRTGFVYGTAEGLATEEQRANLWSTGQAIEDSRITAERKAFQDLLKDLPRLWKGILAEYGLKAARDQEKH